MSVVALANAQVQQDDVSGLASMPINVAAPGGQSAILTSVDFLVAAGLDQLLFTPTAGKRAQIVAVEISTDAATRVLVHFHGSPSLYTIAGGHLPASGGLVKVFGAYGPLGDVNQAVRADVSLLASVVITIHYIEQ